MGSIDWNDVNVLRKLPDGWYSVPSDSKYGGYPIPLVLMDGNNSTESLRKLF